MLINASVIAVLGLVLATILIFGLTRSRLEDTSNKPDPNPAKPENENSAPDQARHS